MLNAWIFQVLERMDGRAVPAQFGPHTKNVQNILNGSVKSSRSEFSDFVRSYLNSLPPPFNDVDSETIGAVVAELGSIAEKSGPLSSFFRSQKMAGRDYPETTKLAEAIDALSESLTVAKTQDAIPAFKAALLGADLLDEDYWRCPSTARDMRLELHHAGDWEAVDTLIPRLRHNCILSLVASWDIEFCAAEFDRFKPIPLLLQVAPKVKAGLTVRHSNSGGEATIDKPKGYRGFGDIIDRPMSLLIDITSCLVYCREHHNWPDQLPSVSKSADTLGTNEQKLAKLRSSVHRMTVYQYNLLLPQNPRLIGHLLPLLVSAHIWECLLLPQPSERKSQEKKAIVSDDVFLRFWNRHKAAQETKGHIFDGDLPWPTFWARPSVEGSPPSQQEEEKLY